MLGFVRLIERTVIVVIFLSMVVLFTLGVVTREIGGTFASQFAWVEEAVRLLNSYLVFLTLGLALERGRHVGIDTLRDRLPAAIRIPTLRVIDLTGVFFSAYLSYLAYGLAAFVLSTGQRSPTLDIPSGWIYFAPVIGFALLGLRFAASLFGLIDRYSHRPMASTGDDT